MSTARRLPIALLGLAVPALAAAQIPLGPQFKVNPDPTPDLMSPRVAVNASGDFVALWYGFGGSTGASSTPAGTTPTARPRPARSRSPIRSSPTTRTSRWRSRRTARSWRSSPFPAP